MADEQIMKTNKQFTIFLFKWLWHVKIKRSQFLEVGLALKKLKRNMIIYFDASNHVSTSEIRGREATTFLRLVHTHLNKNCRESQ